jgi:hypothetical protein
MLKRFLAAAAFAACLASPAGAQQADLPPAAAAQVQTTAPLLPVESMNCDQMTAEMMVAGQTMNAQLDHEGLEADSQTIQDEMARSRSQMAGSMGMGVGMGLACSIPGVGMACGAMMAGQMQQAQQGAAEHQELMNRQAGRIEDSMAGLDQERLMSLSDRYEAMHCQAPQ